MPYQGRQPGIGVRGRFVYTATGGQTTFSGADSNGRTLAYQDGAYVDVYLNGVMLVPTTDFTATTKTSITLTSGATASDIVEILAYDISSIADTVSALNGGSFGGNITVSGSVTATGYAGTVDGTNAVGYRNIPPVGTKTTSYTLQTADVGKYVQVGSGGSVTVPNATFAEGDAVSIFNNTTGDITITCSITTAYIAGTDTDVASVTLATRGVANVLFISGTVAVLTGNIS